MTEKIYDKKKMFLGDMGILACALMWGLSFAAMKEVYLYMGPLWMLTFRFGLTCLLLALLRPKSITRASAKDLKVGLIIGILLILSMGFQAIGLQYISTGKSAFLTAAYVVIVPFIVWKIDGKNPGGKSFIASAICLAGMGSLTLDGSLGLGLGELLTIGCAVTFAFQIIVIDRIAVGLDSLTLTMIETGIAGLLCLAGALIWEPVPTAIPLKTMGWIFYLVMFCTLIPYALQIKSQQYTSPSHASVLFTMESVFAMIIGVLFLGEPMTPRLITGCSLIFLSIFVTEMDISLFMKPVKDRI